MPKLQRKKQNWQLKRNLKPNWQLKKEKLIMMLLRKKNEELPMRKLRPKPIKQHVKHRKPPTMQQMPLH